MLNKKKLGSFLIKYFFPCILLFGNIFSQQSASNFSISLYNGSNHSNMFSKKFKGLNKENSLLVVPSYSFHNNRVYINISPTVFEDNIIFTSAYIKYNIKDSELIFGRFLPSTSSENSKISSGSMIESGNAIPIPRLGFTTTKEYKGVDFKFELYHGLMEKNDQITKAPFLHDKKLYISKKFNKIILTGGLHHTTIWGGASKEYGLQPSSIEDYIRVFFGDKSEDNRGTIEDQGNALGDVRGMWDISIKTNSDINYFKSYYQIFFEDKSGLRLNRYASNFDGLIGLELKYNNHLFLFERLKTTYQGGSSHPPGVDSFYFTRAYPPGWMYNSQTIGNAFILPDNNRVKMLYFYYEINLNDYVISLGQIFGQYFYPFTEKIDYSNIIKNEVGKDFDESLLQLSKKINSNLFIELSLEKFNNELSSMIGITYVN